MISVLPRKPLHRLATFLNLNISETSFFEESVAKHQLNLLHLHMNNLPLLYSILLDWTFNLNLSLSNKFVCGYTLLWGYLDVRCFSSQAYEQQNLCQNVGYVVNYKPTWIKWSLIKNSGCDIEKKFYLKFKGFKWVTMWIRCPSFFFQTYAVHLPSPFSHLSESASSFF